MIKVNTSVLRKLALVGGYSNLIKAVVKNSALLCGKLALRQQLTAEEEMGFSSLEMVDLSTEHIEIANTIVVTTQKIANLLSRCNKAGLERGFGLACKGIDDASLSQVIEAVENYVQELLAESDFRTWIDATI